MLIETGFAALLKEFFKILVLVSEDMSSGPVITTYPMGGRGQSSRFHQL